VREREKQHLKESVCRECIENNNHTVVGLCMKFAFFGFVSKLKRGKAAQASTAGMCESLLECWSTLYP